MCLGKIITPKIIVERILLNGNRQVLLIKRKDNEQWALPGGFVELGERVLDAVVREVREETA